MNPGDMTTEQVERALLYVAESGPTGREIVRRAMDVRATDDDMHRLRCEVQRVPLSVLDGRRS